jgi:hypothetical protein
MGRHLDALKIPFYAAHGSNYTVGRSAPIRKITIHHMAGTPDTLRHLWGNPGRNASSTFAVFPGYLEQYVAIGNTPWTNGNFASNSESITIEVYGDWRAGRTYPIHDQLKNLIRAIRQDIAGLGQTYHQDVSLAFTECPAQLRAVAQRIFDEVTNELNAPAPAPTPAPSPSLSYDKLPAPKQVMLKWAANLWNFNFAAWNQAKSIQGYPAGYVITVVAIGKNSLGGKYYMTAYSYDDGRIRATNGFNVADCADLPAPTPEPTPAPTPEPAPAPTPAPNKPKMVYTKYENPILVKTINDKTSLWDFNYNTWGDISAHKVEDYAKGHEVKVVGDAQHPLGGVYLMTAFSFGEADKTGVPHKTWGFNAVDVKEVEVLPPAEPTPTPEPQPVPTPPVPEPDPSKPDDVPEPTGPGIIPLPGEDAVSWVKRIWPAILSILKKFKFGGKQ